MLSISRPIAVSNRWTPEGILSVVCLACYIVCFLMSLLVFILLLELRQSFPELNTMVLICFLLVSHTVFEIKSIFKPERFSCKVLGLGTHFSLLYSLCWMNICTFHMTLLRVLPRVSVIRNETSVKRFMFYITKESSFSLLALQTGEL